MTVAEIFAFSKHEPAKIDDVERDSNWSYIACNDCQTKVNRGPTSLICSNCGNMKATGVAKYRTELSVYDNDDKATFVLFGDAGPELTGSQASELTDNYFQVNGDMGAPHEKPTPQSLVVTIGKPYKFRVKL